MGFSLQKCGFRKAKEAGTIGGPRYRRWDFFRLVQEGSETNGARVAALQQSHAEQVGQPSR
jgi:hypothetical protein